MSEFEDLLNQGFTARIRSNHALEHATLHMMGEQGFKGHLGGISDAGGFYIYGEASTESVLLAAKEALKRLQEGDTELAVHPNCGTNLVVSGLAAGGLAWMSLLGSKNKLGRRLRRLPVAVLAGLVGYQMAKPLGPKLQESITTNADVGALSIIEVVKHDVLGNTVHRVKTQYSRE